MPQQVRQRKQTTVEFSANNKKNEKLSRGMVYRELYLLLSGAATVLAANNTQANTAKGDEWGVVKRIDIVANGTDVIKSISGDALWELNYYQIGVPRVSSLLGDGATANPTFSSLLVLPFWSPKSIRPIDTALDSRELSDLTIEVTWGTYTDINSAATGFTTEPKLEVYSLESFGVVGPFSQSRTFEIQKVVTSSQTQFQIDLPIGGMYRAFLINTTDAGVDDGDIINNIKLVSGTTYFFDLKEEVLQDIFPLRNALARNFNGQGYSDHRISTSNSRDGWYYIDLVTDGMQSEALDTLGLSEIKLELDVTVGAGTTKIFVWPMQIIPIRGVPGNGATQA